MRPKKRISPNLTPLRCSILAAAAVSCAAAGAGTATLHDGLIVDDSRVYFMLPEQGIEAREIATGASLWQSDAADRPILSGKNGLVAQRDDRKPGQLTLVTLDAGNGRADSERVLSLPDDVMASVDNRLDSRFTLRADSPASMLWRYSYRPVQGAPTADAVARRQQLSGAVTVDAASGRFATASASSVPAVHDAVARVAFATDKDRAFYSSDRQHVLVSNKVENARDSARRYTWRIYDLDGAELGRLDAPVSYTPFVVRDGVLLFVTRPSERRAGDRMQKTPLSLRAFSLERGEELWSSALRETRYAGPFPP